VRLSYGLCVCVCLDYWCIVAKRLNDLVDFFRIRVTTNDNYSVSDEVRVFQYSESLRS